MKNITSLMKTGIISILIFMLIVPGLLPTFSDNGNLIISDQQLSTGDDLNIEQLQTRSRAGDLIVNGTQELTITGTASHTSVWVKDNAILILDDAALTVTQYGRFNVTDNAQIVIKGDSTVLCQWGSFRAHCKSFSIEDSSFHVENGSDPDSLEGFDATISIITTEDISIINSDIWCEGGDGRGANKDVPKGGAGGHSLIEVKSSGTVTISGKKNFGIKSEGGMGGVGGTSSGGKGGDAEIFISSQDKTKEITLTDTILTAIGGPGGPAGKEAGHGGNAYIDINAYDGKTSIIITNSDILSEEGRAGSGGISAIAGISIIYMKCSKLTVDGHKKTETLPSNPESTFQAKDGIDVESKLQPYPAEFYVVNVIDENNERTIPSRPDSDTKTNVYIYWWLTVNVQDESGALIEGATVTISAEAGVSIEKNNDLTDATGKAYFLLYCRKQDKHQTEIDYTVTASAYGAEQSEIINFDDNNHEITIKLQLVTVNITSVMGRPAKPNMIVGGLATVEGFALPAIGGQIQSVKIKVGTGSEVNVIDTSVDINSPYSTWKYDWDTTMTTDDKVTLTVVAIDNNEYEAHTSLMVKIDQEIVNDAPELVVSYPINNSYVNSSGTNKIVKIYGYVKDYDYNSKLLSEGKNVTEVFLVIRAGSGNVVYSETDYIDAITDWDALNYSWDWSFDWDVWLETAGEYNYPNGNYIMTIYAKDDGGMYSTSEVIKIQLLHHIYPIAVISKLEFDDGGKRTEVKVDITQAGTVGTYAFYAPKGENKISLYFDGSGSYDIDGVGDKPSLYYWEFDEYTHSPWDSNSTITHEYILVPKDTEDEKTLTYIIKLKVRDSDGLQNQILMVEKEDGSTVKVSTVEIVIIYRPPAEKPAGFFWQIANLETEDSTELVRLIFILPLIILNVVGAAILLHNKRVVAKKRKAREEAMEARVEKEKAAEEKKAAEYLSGQPSTTTSPPAAGTTAAAGAAPASIPGAAAVPAVSATPPAPGEPVVGKVCENCGTEVSMDSRMDKCPQCGGNFAIRI
jgi:hypothetical protein